MQFVKTEGWQAGTQALSKRLTEELKAGKKVLWLVPGGSNIPASVAIMNNLPVELTENLAILLTDERYGLPGHPDSNFKQLHDAGFNPQQATFIPALVENLKLQDTTQRYEELVQQAFAHAEVTIGQFGIGPDGHIAGILPRSPATNSNSLVASYEAPPFVRLTMTFEALRRLQVAYAFVFGAEKRAALDKLKAEDLTLAEQPSQILKQLPEAYIYNDQIGG
ncbi:MAG TPA: 6-phosphogluconolactonase [Candidatus Saccharimonadales bacterium]|nr:6-phosphogluconolactonase [Candidatus Saccharimonadales bacterium]